MVKKIRLQRSKCSQRSPKQADQGNVCQHFGSQPDQPTDVEKSYMIINTQRLGEAKKISFEAAH